MRKRAHGAFTNGVSGPSDTNVLVFVLVGFTGVGTRIFVSGSV